MKKQPKINVVGAGMAGSEAAWMIARHGFKVHLHEMKPRRFSPAHKLEGFAELVCSNSLGSMMEYSAPQLLKEEMQSLGSLILEGAYHSQIPAGKALGVDRELLSRFVTEKLASHPNIEIVREEFTKIDPDEMTIVATGPLTSDALSEELARYIGSDTLYFYDSISPIIDADSIDYSKTFFGSRYEENQDDYLNCPLTKDQYFKFVEDIKNAEKVPVRDFEEMKCFEACMPVEVLVDRGPKTLMFGPMKPVGLFNPHEGRRPYAVVQLRRENMPTTMYNMVGFQTRMKWGDQKRVFQTIPGLENAEFIGMGSMHRNTYIDSPRLLDKDLFLKNHRNVGLAGQLTGVEGYVDSAAMGMMIGLSLAHRVLELPFVQPPLETALGALMNHVTTSRETGKFTPMNINFGLLPQLETQVRMEKKDKKIAMVRRAREHFVAWKSTLEFFSENRSNGHKPRDIEHHSRV
ncbi:MAG: methylenetetrahydrofolate--tRNA-(uracil(54)-C(5))-methyltransferase (FADH(2)-oxidizing) TrmFO [Bdellovibrionota bacterium]